MSNETEPQKAPEHPTPKDLFEQTEDVRRDLSNKVMAVADHVDAKSEQATAVFAEQVEATRESSVSQLTQAENDHRVDLLLEKMQSNEVDAKRQIDKKFNRYLMWFLAIFFVLAVISIISLIGVLRPQAGVTLFTLGDPLVTSPTALCAGESLDFSVGVSVKEKGAYILDMSTWKIDPPPATIILSEGQRMVIGDNRSFPIARKWVIPPTYLDPATNEYVKWTSGRYSRDISVTAAGKNVESSTKSIYFTIREECP